jgi:transposase-like protein
LFWENLFDNMKERGLRDARLIVSDGHKGDRKSSKNPFLDQADRCVTYIW